MRMFMRAVQLWVARRRFQSGLAAGVAAAILVLGCGGGGESTSELSQSTGAQGSTSAPPPNGGAAPGTQLVGPYVQPSCDASMPPSASETRRLTKSELSNTLNDLLGPAVHTTLAALFTQLPDDNIFAGITRFENRYSALHTKVLTDIAYTAASQATATDALANALLTAQGASCNGSNITPTCVRTFIGNLGLRAWRRPLTAAEITWLESAYGTGSSVRDRIAVVVATLIGAPDFVYHMEQGTPAVGAANDFTLTQHEVANRLSYGILGTMPSTALQAQAARGDLSNPAILQSTVNTMLDDPRARAKVREFFTFWLGTDNLPGISANPNFLAGLDTSGLRDEMKRELEEYIEQMVWIRGADYRELMTSPISYARTPALASIHGHGLAANPAAGTQQMGSGRKGLLLRGPFLIATDDYTHPIMRGVRMRTRLLCDTLGSPSPDAFAAQTKIQSPNFVKMFSNRERVTQSTSDPSCMACHRSINPLGFAFEGLDSAGRFRTMEMNYDGTNQLIAQHAINNVVTDLAIDYAIGESSNSAAQLIDTIAQSGKGSLCMARQLHRYYQMRAESMQGDACSLVDTRAALAGTGGSVRKGIQTAIGNRALARKVVAP
jgi:hypothetical protein